MKAFVLVGFFIASASSAALAAPTRPGDSVPKESGACGAVATGGKACLFPVLGNQKPAIAALERAGPAVAKKFGFFGLPLFPLLGLAAGAGGIAALDAGPSSPR